MPDQIKQEWAIWSKHVLLTLEKLENKVDELDKKITSVNLDAQLELNTLRTKTGMWGIVSGFIVSAIVSVIAGVLIYQLTMVNHIQTNLPITPTVNHIVSIILPRVDHFPVSISEEEG